jgi:hypothetical protein
MRTGRTDASQASPSGCPGIDRAGVIQLAPAGLGFTPEGLHVHGQGEVGPFPGHGGALGRIEVPPGQLAQGVSPALGRYTGRWGLWLGGPRPPWPAAR